MQAQIPDVTESATELVDECLAAVLRGEKGICPPALEDPGQFAERAIFHGIQCLLMSHPGFLSRLPEEVSHRIRKEALSFTSWEIRNRPAVQSLLAELAGNGIRFALLKGTALAYSCYTSPAERPRGDVDLLVSAEDLDRTGAILTSRGFQALRGAEVARLTQDSWRLKLSEGMSLDIDLHYNLLPFHSTSDVFVTEDLLDETEPLPALCPEARMLSDAMALLHACIHRATHFRSSYRVGDKLYYDGDRLIWLYDIHLLASRMDTSAWNAFFASVRVARGSAPLCINGIESARARFGTDIPPLVIEALGTMPAHGDLYAFYMQSSSLKRFWKEFGSLPPGESKLAYLRAFFFPPATSLRRAYPQLADKPLFFVHIYRYWKRAERYLREKRQKSRFY